MDRKQLLNLISIMCLSILITALTGLINTTPPMWVGAAWYGLPFPWRIRAIVMDPYEVYSLLVFFIDAAIWSGIFIIILLILQKTKNKREMA